MPSEANPGEPPIGARVVVTLELEGTVHGYGHSIGKGGRFVAIDNGLTRTFVQLDNVVEMLAVPSDVSATLNPDAGLRRHGRPDADAAAA